MAEQITVKKAVFMLAGLGIGLLLILVVLEAVGVAGGTVNNALSPGSISKTQPDVLVQYSNGLVVGYNASPENQWNDGNILVEITNPANEVSGENIYLKAETYNTSGLSVKSSRTIYQGNQVITNVNLYGAGKYQTIINAGCLTSSCSGVYIYPGYNSVTADLSTYGYDWGNYQYANNSTLRNVFMQGLIDDIYMGYSENVIYAENDTLTSGWDNLNMVGDTGNVLIFDSQLLPNMATAAEKSINSGCQLHGTVNGGNVMLVNTAITIANGLCTTFYRAIGVSQSSNSAYIYGGSISTPPPIVGGFSDDINATSGTVFINASLSYNAIKSTGTISNTLGPYGSYTYDHSPLIPPGGPWATTGQAPAGALASLAPITAIMEVIFIVGALDIMLRMFGASIADFFRKGV